MPVQGIIITHGNLAEEFLKTIEELLGPQEAMTILSNTALSFKDLLQMVDEKICAIDSDAPLVIMTDVCGGSCYNASFRMMQNHTNVRIVSGLNIPMVISFLQKRDQVPFEDLVSQMMQDAIHGIRTAQPADK